MPQSQAKNLSLIAAIDLGSNSFHMVVAKAQNSEIRILERLGEKVQLAAGIDEERQLSEESMQRGLDCLKRFAQLINGMPPGAVRSPDDWAPIVELPGAPQGSPELSASAAARQYADAAGQGAWRRALAPRHQSAVRKSSPRSSRAATCCSRGCRGSARRS
jgi:hypothetical protein